MEVASSVRIPQLILAPEVVERAKREGKFLVLYPTLKFSCFIAKRFEAELSNHVPSDALRVETNGLEVFIRFRAIGSRFCGGERGFEDFDFPLKEPDRFIPKWIKVNGDLSGDFGYL